MTKGISNNQKKSRTQHRTTRDEGENEQNNTQCVCVGPNTTLQRVKESANEERGNDWSCLQTILPAAASSPSKGQGSHLHQRL